LQRTIAATAAAVVRRRPQTASALLLLALLPLRLACLPRLPLLAQAAHQPAHQQLRQQVLRPELVQRPQLLLAAAAAQR
jgi:hypothetical protein